MADCVKREISSLLACYIEQQQKLTGLTSDCQKNLKQYHTMMKTHGSYERSELLNQEMFLVRLFLQGTCLIQTQNDK